MAHFRDAAPGSPAILVEHDLTFTLYRQLAETQTQSPRPTPNTTRWLEFERRWLKAYDGVWTVSEDDREIALRESGRRADRTFNVPNGVDVDRFRPEPGEQSGEIFYVGIFRHLPNIIGFEKLEREVMPLVWQRFPDAKLRVVAGPRHTDFWKERPLDPRIEMCGFVEDLRPLYASAAVVVVPLEVSAGTNIKVLEAMACGKPVVSTPVGCQGLDLMDDVDAIVREGWSEFAEAVASLLADTDKRRSIGERARATVEGRFSWTTVAERAYESYSALHRSGVSFEDLRHVLRKRRARHHHVAAGFLRLLLQLSLNVRKIADQADALRLRAAFQFADQLQRIGRLEIQVEDDQLRPALGLFDDFRRAPSRTPGPCRRALRRPSV